MDHEYCSQPVLEVGIPEEKTEFWLISLFIPAFQSTQSPSQTATQDKALLWDSPPPQHSFSLQPSVFKGCWVLIGMVSLKAVLIERPFRFILALNEFVQYLQWKKKPGFNFFFFCSFSFIIYSLWLLMNIGLSIIALNLWDVFQY